MRKRYLLLLLPGSLLCAAVNVMAQDAPPASSLPPAAPESAKVTLGQATRYALAHNAQILAFQHSVAGARSNLSGQRSIINPTLQFSGLNNTVTSLNFRNPANYVLSGVIETSGRRAIRTEMARAQLAGAGADSRTAQLTVQHAVTAAYVSLQAANEAMQSELQAFADARRVSDLTEQQFKLGSAPETNSLNARIALEQEINNLRAVATTVEQGRALLDQAMGRDPSEPVDVVDPLDFAPVESTLPELLALALRSRPEIESAEASERALRATVRQQRSQFYPDVYAQTSARFDGAFFGVSAPLWDFGSIRGAVRKAHEDVEVQQSQTLQARQQVKLDVESAWLAMIQAQEQVVRSRDQIVPRAQTLFAKVEQGYRIGGNTILDLLSAQATLRTTRTDLNTTRANYRQARAQLERAAGAPLPR